MRFAAKQFYLLKNFDLLTGTKDIEMNKIFSVLALLLWMPISHAQSVWLQLQSRHDTVEIVEVPIGDYRVPPAISATLPRQVGGTADADVWRGRYLQRRRQQPAGCSRL